MSRLSDLHDVMERRADARRRQITNLHGKVKQLSQAVRDADAALNEFRDQRHYVSRHLDMTTGHDAVSLSMHLSSLEAQYDLQLVALELGKQAAKAQLGEVEGMVQQAEDDLQSLEKRCLKIGRIVEEHRSAAERRRSRREDLAAQELHAARTHSAPGRRLSGRR